MAKESPRSFPTAPILIGALLLMGGGAYYLLRDPPVAPIKKEAPAPAEEQAPRPRSGYSNRAVWHDATPAAAQKATIDRPAIRGTVYDLEGSPLEGAAIIATTFEQAGNLPTTAAATRTDASGRFELPLQEGAYQVNAALDGYGPSSATVRTGDTVSLLLPRSGQVRGHVYDAQHRPLPNFNIDVISVVPGHMPAPAPLWSKGFTDPEGAYLVNQFPAWPVVLRATAPGFAPAFSAPITVKTSEKRDLDLTLSPGCTLTGRVEDKAGAPVPYVLLDAESRLTAGSASELSLQSGNQTQSAADGTFQLAHVPTGTVLVRAYDGGHAVTSVAVEVESCEKAAPVKVVLSSGGAVTGVARTSDGKVLPGAMLLLSHRAVGIVTARSDEGGRFRFERIPPGLVRMELHHQGQRTLESVTVKEGEENKHDMVLFARGQGELRGRVTANGRPVAGARLIVASSHGDEGVDTHYPVTGADGSYRVQQMPPGMYLVSVISTSEGQGVKLDPGGVVTVNLDVKPKPEEEDKEEPEAVEEEPAKAATPPPAPGASPSKSP